MQNKVIRFIRETHMLEPGDRVIAAVSGGADSICLLSILNQLRTVLPVSVRVIHVHHGLRGVEADRDEAWVQEVCGRMEIPFFSVHRDVRAYAGEHGMSEEEAGRVLRYEAFEQMAREWDEENCKLHLIENSTNGTSFAKIALAHHQEDQAETILHHLLRGSGLRGLSGMHPVQGRRIRPLLCVGREEIREYLKREKLCWCEDSTNESGDYTRNRIRRELLPMMENLVNARAQENLLHAGELFAQADAYLEEQALAVWRRAGREDGKGEAEAPSGAAAGIALDEFRAQQPIIRSYLIRILLDHAQPGWKDITRRHFDSLDRLAFGSVGGSADLPGDLRAQTGYRYLWICKFCESSRAETQEVRENSDRSGEISAEKIPEEKRVPNLQMRIFPHEKGAEFPKNLYTKWFDYDKIKTALSVRFREEGDYLSIPGGKRKTAARYMIDEKIPRHLRDQIPLLAEGSHVLWVIGYRISEYYKITDDTKTVLEVTLDGGERNGR
ncbi:tRNA lysidine(34) synthetase TilS [Brotaphodocola sp.]|uniref:tRNA lysidine(34) synthetase TilS n=1 Tax=Brotaphodocola sp. TaxID=3073577 RepID=UPI003D7DAAFE